MTAVARGWRAGRTAALAALCGWAQIAATATGLLDFTPTEQAQILRHGPWPPPPAHDPGNALAGRPAAIALGRALFSEPRLSPDGRLSCASCHVPARAFTDGRPRAEGRQALDRNTPSLWNAGHQRWLGWDGAFDSLWSQALHPLLSAQEMASHADHLQALLRVDAGLACAWRQATGRAPAADPAEAEATLVLLGQALGAYVATLVSGRSAFDEFRDALARGDRRAAARYPLQAQRGLRLFIGRGQCSTCHVGPLFSNGEFADIGAPFFVRPGVVDPGRHGGIAALLASPYNLLGRWASAPRSADDADPARKTRHVLAQPRNFGEFKVPSLRGVADTAPYLHDGQLATLDDVVRHYSDLNLDRLHADGELILKPLNLGPGEQTDLVAFLRSLSARPARQPPAPRLRACRS